MCLNHLLNIILILFTAKKTSKLSFCSGFKTYVLMVLTSAFVFKINRTVIFSTTKKESFPQSKKISPIKEVFHNQGNFPQSRKYSAIKSIFHSQGNFSQSRKISTINEIFHNQGDALQSRKFSTIKKIFHNWGNFLESRKFSKITEFSPVKEILCNQVLSINKLFLNQGDFPQKNLFDQENFAQTRKRKFSTARKVFHRNLFSLIKHIFHKQGFSYIKNIFCKQRSKMFSKS